MASSKPNFDHIMVWLLVGAFTILRVCSAHNHNHSLTDNKYPSTSLSVDISRGRQIPPIFFGIFFEEINHAGAGGLWAELISNRGFEAGGRHIPSMISPWGAIGDEEAISIVTELSSCFKNNPVALRMDIHCDQTTCPPGGVGIYNPGYWGMNIEEGNGYKVVFHIKSTGPLDSVMSLVSEDGTQVLAFQRVTADAAKVKDWTKLEITLQARASYKNARFQFTTTQKGTIWLDQVSVMPNNTYKGHGFRTDLMEMLLNLKPRFLRFPGGCYVEGRLLSNAFRWKETVGPWEERPGHFGDVWNYWSDDGLGYLEYLQLAEDLGAEPVWVVNNGIGLQDQVDTHLIGPFVQEMLDSVEFAIGSPNSTWGSLRAKLGHPTPFNLRHIAFGNEGCDLKSYTGNYLKFYKALKKNYPNIKVISNCDATQKPLDHPADLYDFHRYTNDTDMLGLTHLFGKIRRDDPHAPKAFVSEYAVIYPQDKMKNGSFGGALAEAAFLLSLEQNSDVVEMVSYAPLFVNLNDRTWNPDAIFFNTYKAYGIASYWVQTFFKESSGASLLNVHFHNHSMLENTYVTAISWTNKHEKKNYITIKVVNYNNVSANLKISINGVDANSVKPWRKTVLTCDDLQADNTLDNPTKVVPISSLLKSEIGRDIVVEVEPYSFTAFDLINNGQSPSLEAKQVPNS
ncbi:alpha-L-arabinofuranosidase 1 isoform X1 [Spinacia oleracea]|uniref:non-reducing end alpha-L-arabinofuranosidase n=1 Tax=Spinacia oleracea TaxID=3562 RepID=A0ABM3QNB0_SPIOL|nr:alpha-L-arabinofuranosidase 1-like isoform X1 [Spinacia oleracea]XP_056684839.1 alpha-L-arabinofuranosidase 1-like isoform X1 [Spinacia oleracea]